MWIKEDKNCACPTFRCAICNRNYTTIKERSECEAKCLAEREKAEAKKKELELKAEKDKRYKEVVDAYEKYSGLRKQYVKDYGSYTFQRTYDVRDDACDNTDDSYARSLRSMLSLLDW